MLEVAVEHQRAIAAVMGQGPDFLVEATTGSHALGADALGVGRLLCGIAIAEGDTGIVGGGQRGLGPGVLAPGLRATGAGAGGAASGASALGGAGIGSV